MQRSYLIYTGMDMGTRFKKMAPAHQQFIEKQSVFFVGTATKDSTVNVSPKGMDYLRVLDANRVVWMNLTGSANESAAHVQHNPRMTMMFCAFSGNPLILRLFGSATVIHHQDPQWQALSDLFPQTPSARQIFDMQITTVQTSCGFGVPLMTFEGERSKLDEWAQKKGQAGIEKYWQDNNQVTIDGIETNIMDLNFPK